MAKKQKLLFKPTSIRRLSKMTVPLPMVGDPKWNHHARGSQAWASREKAVYAHEMERKHPSPAWSPDLWIIAQRDNGRLDYWLSVKWDRYEEARDDNYAFDRVEAEKENAVIDYHCENYLEPAI